MKKKKMKITDREIMELLSDPISMDIIGVLESHTYTLEEIVDKLNEKKSLIEDYIKNMIRAGLLIKTDEGYKTSADTFEFTDLLPSTNKRNADWVRGFINHMENGLIDNLDYLHENDVDKKEKLYENLKIKYTGVYLNDEEAKELNEMISNFIDEKDNSKRKGNTEYQKYSFYQFTFPEMKK
ncbi:MAG: hypothetical protein ACQEQF_09725 [Bacillota bacterium]